MASTEADWFIGSHMNQFEFKLENVSSDWPKIIPFMTSDIVVVRPGVIKLLHGHILKSTIYILSFNFCSLPEGGAIFNGHSLKSFECYYFNATRVR